MVWGRKQELPAPQSGHVPLNRYTVYNAERHQSCKVSCMADPTVVAVANVGIALTKVLLRACDSSLGADLVGDNQELVGILSRALRRTDESKGQIERRVSQALLTRTKAIRERCSDQGVDPNLLSGACTEVEIILKEIANDGALLLSAVRSPENFPETLWEHAARRRMNVESAAEPYFDELMNAVAAQYGALAPWSPRFQIEAFKSILSGIDEIQENSRLSLDAHAVTHNKLDTLSSKLAEVVHHEHKPSRVFFGSRPDVVASDRYIERDDQKHLNALIIDPTKRRMVLVGMRGCGKTQLAAALAQECEDANWNLVAWINAVSRESIQSDLVEFAKQLGIGTSDQPTQEQIIARCLNYLRSNEASDRIVIFDNVEDINHLRGLMPNGNGLRVIATTTNNSGWEYQDWTIIKVGVFDRSESINYLLTVANSTDRDAANALAERLGDLPLAVTQAAFAARRMSLTTHENNNLSVFNERIQTSPPNALRAIDGTTYSEDTLQALAQAAHSAMDAIGDEQYEDGMRILMAMTYLSKSGVPTQLLTPTGSTNEISAYRHLIDTSILTSSNDGRFTYLHTLQGAAIRNHWNETESKVASRVAGTLLFLTLKSCLKETNFTEKVTIARSIIEQLSAIHLQTYSAQVLACQSAIHCLHSIFPLALELNIPHEAIQLKDALRSAFSEGYIDTRDYYITIGNLANCYLDAGLPQSALRLYQDALHNLECLLESSDVNILALRAGLARSYTTLENYEKAIDTLLSTLVELTNTVGANDFRTLRTRSYLANCFLTSGDFQATRDQYELICTISKEHFGENSSETLTALNNLDMVRFVYFPSESLSNLVATYEKMVKILDIDHPHCIAAANNIAYLLERIGRIGEASALFEHVLKQQIRIFGKEHRDTLRTRTHLASIHQKLRDAERASLLNATPLASHIASPSDRALTEAAYERLEATKRRPEQHEEESVTE